MPTHSSVPSVTSCSNTTFHAKQSVADLVGKKLKDFYVLRRLGRGAMAEVYLAQQLSLGRQVALKVLNTGLAQDPNYVRRFHHEARAAAARSAEQLLRWPFTRVVMAHNQVIEADAHAQVARALAVW